MNGWKYYNHAMIPNCAPHEEVDFEPFRDGSIWKTSVGIPLLARWTSEFDCGYKTEFWYTVLDHRFDLNSIKAKHRYQIKQGLKNFKVREINFYTYKNDLLIIFNKIRTQAYNLPEVMSLSNPGKGVIYLGSFDIESEKLVGYAVLT